MNKRKQSQTVSDTALASATVLGIAGVVTGNPGIQVAAYTPAVIEKMVLGICKKGGQSHEQLGKELEQELKEIVRAVCKEAQKSLQQESVYLASFFQYVSPRIEAEYKKGFSISEMASWIREEMDAEKKWEGAFLTERDISGMLEKFMQIFVEKALDYPRVGQYLNLQAIFNHEERIQKLEQAVPHQDGQVVREVYADYLEEYYDDNQAYADKYEEVLFLHKKRTGIPEIRLKDIFVRPEAESLGYYAQTAGKQQYKDISEALKDFIQYCPCEAEDYQFDYNILFIEGQAAMGKSSLVAWMAWNYVHKTDISKEIFRDKKLIVIRLRDLLTEHSSLNLQLPFEDIYRYLLGSTWRERQGRRHAGFEKELFQDTVLILDGFDELCMVEDIVNEGKDIYFYNMNREVQKMECNCKVIITSRPSYIKIDPLDFPKMHLMIMPFSKKKREELLGYYEKKQKVLNEVRGAFLEEQDQELESLLETPLVLYMVLAKNIVLSKAVHIWEMYDQIFSKEIYERSYDREGAHTTYQYKAALSELTAEIANAVSGEQHFFIHVEKLLERENVRNLVDKLDKLKGERKEGRDKIQTILSDCFGVASYFKISHREDETGRQKDAVEFYHNNIKDYFCCEYIWQNLERIYCEIPEDTYDMEKWFISNFQELFQYSVFMKDNSFDGEVNMAVRFFKDKVLFRKEAGIETDFIRQELKQRYFRHFFGRMLQTGIIYKYEYSGKENIIDMMANIYSSVLPIYQGIYQPYLKEGEVMSLAEYAHTTQIGTSFIFRILFLNANIHNLSYLGFDNIMLSGISFEGRDFRYSSFKECLLIGCIFHNCDLRGTDFEGAQLSKADLRTAVIDGTTSFKDAVFQETLISKEQCAYIQSEIEGELVIC